MKSRIVATVLQAKKSKCSIVASEQWKLDVPFQIHVTNAFILQVLPSEKEMKQDLMNNAIYNEYNVEELQTTFRYVRGKEILSVAALTQLHFTISDQLENVAQRTFSATTSAPWRAYCPQSDIFKEVGPDHCALWEKVKYRTGWIRTFFLYPKSFISPWGDTVVFVSLLVVILTPARRVSPRDFRKLIISTTKMMLSRVGSGKMIFFLLDKSWCRSFAAAMLLLL